MSSYGTPVHYSGYPHNPGVQLVWVSNYPDNPGVHSVWSSDYPNNPGVILIHYTEYEYNPGVMKIYQTGCFPKSELIQTRSNLYVPIGSLKIGDMIRSWDMVRGKAQHTAVTKVHRYTVNDIVCLNNRIRVSASHPLLTVECNKSDLTLSKWKVAYDINIGDALVGVKGERIAVKSKCRQWYSAVGIEVLNLSTENGDPFFVGGFIVRAKNAQDSIAWADTPVTQKFMVA